MRTEAEIREVIELFKRGDRCLRSGGADELADRARGIWEALLWVVGEQTPAFDQLLVDAREADGAMEEGDATDPV